MATVDDEGIGIPEAERTLVLEPFHRAWNVRESRIPGTGLGLYICRRLVEAHGGRLWLGDRPDGRPGTRVTFTLPLLEVAASARVDARTPRRAPERRPWLSGSSSSRTSRSSPRSSSCGWRGPATGRSSPRPATTPCAASTKTIPDLVILDVALPGLDGWQVIERIREFSRVPILMVTARSSEADKIRGLKLGADDYITKPL